MKEADLHQHKHVSLRDEVKKLVDQGYEDVVIESLLRERGEEHDTVLKIMGEIKKMRNAKQSKTGSLFILAGVLVLGVGFISCIVVHNLGGSMAFPLYGMTSIGLILLMIGLMMIF